MMEFVNIRLDSVNSTNSYAKTHAHEFSPNQITCIVAEEQTSGRGRYQRKWVSPRGVNLYATFYFRLPVETPHIVSLAQVMTYSFATMLKREGLSPEIKWPNDVRLSGKKVSGVLCETVFHREHVDLILGIGINVNMEAEDLAMIDQPATSLKCETGRVWDRHEVLKKLQKQFGEDLDRFKKEGFAPFRHPFEELLAFKGKTVRCLEGKKEWVGICLSLTDDGRLNLLLPDKTIHSVSSGDIET